jgi:hypothetical protein
MRSILLITLFTLASFLSFGQAPKLSKDAEISILTCSPGPDLHEIFGHSAIRISDKENNIDWVFGWGSFDFNTPNFYVKFVKGSLLYTISVRKYNSFIATYKYNKRSVTEQTLNLDSISKQQIVDAILVNYKPENRYYKYDFQLDNCATRIRDIFEKNCSSQLQYSFADQDKTYRDILREYLTSCPWTDWGINTVLGKNLDDKASTRDYMYIPDYLMYMFDSASLNGESIIKDKKTVYQAPQTIFNTPWYLGPEFILSLLALIVIAYSLYCFKNKILRRWPDYIIFGLFGLIGSVILFLCFFSDYHSMPWNYNMLIFSPTHIVAILFLHKRDNFYLKKYFWLSIIAVLHAIGLFYLTPIGPQALPLASIPLILIVLVRAYMISKNK